MQNKNKGFSTPAVIGAFGLILIILGAFYYASSMRSPVELEENLPENEVEQENDTVAEEKIDGEIIFSGKLLAGGISPLLDFNKKDYEKAIAGDKLVVLYFYASWCPICRLEFPKMQKAFDSLDTDKVIGFRVNYNDSDTDAYEKELAKQFGVAYQHTKVFIQNGERVLKSPESWDENRYREEINNFFK